MMTELLFRDDAYLKTATARVLAATERGIELDRTVFYPQGGGQAGDTGTLLRASGGHLAITDTRKGEAADRVLLLVAPGRSPPQPGEAVTLEIDWQRRYQLMRLHTALHLLSCVIGAPVTVGNIVDDKGRLDFDIELSMLNAARIESETNALIASGIATESVWITDAELDAQPELVKTMSVQPPRGAGRLRLLKIPGIDLQPCGGTHIANIAEIGGIRGLRIRHGGQHKKRGARALAGSRWPRGRCRPGAVRSSYRRRPVPAADRRARRPA